ncbi:MAG: YwbE family protein [Epsilonproteobacteria bacterium]|nr:YwbE family protein [Campylobacterota bacterium]
MQENKSQEGQKRTEIKYGMNVGIVLKEDQSTGYITYGKVQKILTNSPTHPHGIKVRLSSGEVGRVKKFVK